MKLIGTIKSIINENKDKSIPNMIKTLGISDAIKYFGNYYTIESYLNKDDKVNYIKEKVYELNDGRSINLSVINGDTIHYSEKDGKLQLIEWLGKENVTVKTYGDNDNYIGTFYVNYESLPSQIIEELVEIFINR
jgi:FlaG/FlaF family flagellin (archaellin)